MMPRRIWLPVLASLPVLAALLWLGTWQVQRLHWKTDMLARIAAAEAGPPRAAGRQRRRPTPRWWRPAGSTMRGRPCWGSRCAAPTLGGHLVTPLLRDGAPPLLVDRGWVPLERATAASTGRRARSPSPATSAPPIPATGTARRTTPPGGASTSSTRRRSARRWACRRRRPSGWWRWRRPGRRPGLLPAAAASLPRPDNPHLGYAITWYGLAAALVGVLIAFLLRRDREPAA